MGKRPGRGPGPRREGERAAPHRPRPGTVGVTLGGGAGPQGHSGSRAHETWRELGRCAPRPALRGRRGGGVSVLARSAEKGKTKSFGGQGLPGRLSRNSFALSLH